MMGAQEEVESVDSDNPEIGQTSWGGPDR